MIKNAAQWKDVPVEKNYLIPPYHWHWYQEEYFDVKKGYVRTLLRIGRIGCFGKVIWEMGWRNFILPFLFLGC